MPKKSCGRKKGIQRSIPRHRIGRPEISGSQEGESNETGSGEFLALSRSKYLLYGQKCFEILLSTCSKFHLIRFTRKPSGEYVLLNGRDKILHYTAMTFSAVVCLQKVLGTTEFLLYEELCVESFMCITLAAMHLCSALKSVVLVMRPKETVDLLNSLSYHSPVLDRIDAVTKLNPLWDTSTCCKVISITFVLPANSFALALLSIFMSNLPIWLVPLAERLGLLSDGILSRFAWQILFAPLEWLTLIPALSIIGFSSPILFMGTDAHKIFLKSLRMLRVNSLRSRQHLERMYVQLELFSRIFQVWIRSYFPAWLVLYSCGTIVCLFVTIRHTELPLIYYMCNPNTVLIFVTLIFWQSIDLISVTKGSESILGVLLQQQAQYLKYKTRSERVQILKRARSMRALAFPLAGGEFSWSVPVNTWEEILNQTLFLLSL